MTSIAAAGTYPKLLRLVAGAAAALLAAVLGSGVIGCDDRLLPHDDADSTATPIDSTGRTDSTDSVDTSDTLTPQDSARIADSLARLTPIVPLTVGSYWQLDQDEPVLTRITIKIDSVTETNGRTEYHTFAMSSNTGLILFDSSCVRYYFDRTFEPYGIAMQYPGMPGDVFRVDSASDGSIFTHSIVAVDSVITTPAGRFNCYVYRHHFELETAGRTVETYTFAAPGVGIVGYDMILTLADIKRLWLTEYRVR